METAKDRLVAAYDQLKFLKKVDSKSDFSEKLGFGRSYVSRVMNGFEQMSFKFAYKMEQAFSISNAWLLEGEGEMFTSPEKSPEKTTKSEADDLNSQSTKEQPDMQNIMKDKALADIAAANLILAKSVEKAIEIIERKLGDNPKEKVA